MQHLKLEENIIKGQSLLHILYSSKDNIYMLMANL